MLDANLLPAPTHAGAEPSTTVPVKLRRGALLLLAACAVLAGGCQSKDIDGVRHYKSFLEKVRPALTAMNRSREELYALENPDLMQLRFKDDLLPEIRRLAAAANELSRSDGKPDGKLGEIHESLRTTLGRYAEATEKLVDSLKKAKSEEQREGAIVSWGEQDNQFGREMAALVEDLSRYLDQLNKK